jgi:branched-chain amino acid transport system permease protein
MISELINVLIGGISIGALYALMSIGLSLVYGVTRIFNFAYGSFLVWGGYLGWLIYQHLHFNYLSMIAAVLVIMFILGTVTQITIISPLLNRPNWDITTMMVTLALALVMDSTSLIIFGPYSKRLPAMFDVTLNFGNFSLSADEFGRVILSVLIVLSLELFFRKSMMGQSIEAVAQDETGAKIVGIPLNRIRIYAFGISASIAGISGIIIGSTYFISPLSGWAPFCKAFVIVAFGGAGSLTGTLFAAFLLGEMEALIAWQIGTSWVMVFWFVTLAIVLIIKPKGLLGKWG